MTNYNERLDDVIDTLVENAADSDSRLGYVEAYEHAEKAKQAITSLIKELVAEAKPAQKDQLAQLTNGDEGRCRFYRYGGYNFAINQYEQNLLKELEEVK